MNEKLLKLLGIKSFDDLFAVEGLTEEQKTKLKENLAAKTKDFDKTFAVNFIPRSEFNDKNELLKTEVKTHGELKTSIQALKDLGVTSVEDYNKKIKELGEGHQLKLDDLKKEETTKLKAKKVVEAFTKQKGKNIELLMKNIDLDKVEMSEDGTIYGHQSQIDIQKEKYPNMFDKEKIEGADGGKKNNQAAVALNVGDEGYLSEAEVDKMTDKQITDNWEAIQNSSKTWG